MDICHSAGSGLSALGVLLAVCLAACGPRPAAGSQPLAIRVDATAAYTDNLFNSYSQRSDWIRQLHLDLDYGRGSTALYYSAHANMYTDYDDLFTQTHVLGASAVRRGPDRRLFSADLSLATRAGTADYGYKNYLEGVVNVGAKVYPRPALMLRGGAALRLREYSQAGDFSYVEPSAHVLLSRFLPSRTTLQAGATLGAKAYLRAGSESTEDFSPARTATDRVQARASVWLKVAQSLGPATGVNIRVTRKELLSGTARYRLPEEYDPEEELFDDQYSYTASQGRVGLKHVLGADTELVGSLQLEKRRYTDRPALTLDGFPAGAGETRDDTRTRAYLRVERTLTRTPAPLTDLGVALEWSLQRVDSNDPYYDATARLYAISLRGAF
jgi:hypothetical protein